MNSPDLMSFNSPLRHKGNLKNSRSPGNNPFDSVLKTIESTPQDSEFVDISRIRPEEYFLKCDVGDFLEKESLGILKLEQLESSFNNDVLSTDKLSFKLNTVLERPSPVRELPQVNTFQFNSHSPKIRLSLNYEDTQLKVKLLNNSVNKCDKVAVGTDNIDDSVLVEANHLASKLADGSILINGDYIKETTLDCTTPPDFVESEEEEPEEIINTETVFKEIDKIVPVLEENLDPPVPQHEEFKENLDNIFNKARRQSICANADPKELLTNLYSIISNEKQDPKQNEKGQQLLLSLANVLCSENNCDNLEDSGHSSTEDDQQNDSYEILDLRVNKTTKTEDKHCFEPLQTTPFNNVPNNTKSMLTTKIKPRKLEDKGKKGPLKAVIPVMDMSKGFTPLKFQRTPHLRTIDTPINEQLKPIAQSTPGAAPAISVYNQLPSFSSNCKKSSANSVNSRLSQATSTPNLSNKPETSLPKFFYRRHSSTELKTTDVKVTLTRNSAGPNKLKPRVSSISSTPTRKSMLATQINPRNVLNEKNRGLVRNAKSLNLFAKIQKNGKENIEKNLI